MNAPVHPKRVRRARASVPRSAKPRAKRRDLGGMFQDAVFAALDELVPQHLASWDHVNEETRRIPGGRVIVVGKAPPDVTGFTPEGFIYYAEIKHDLDRVYVATNRPAKSQAASVKPHQRAKLDAAAATTHGSADLIVCVGGIVAVLPWPAVRRVAWIDRESVASLAAAHDDGVFSARVRHHMRLEGM